jgi:hypothetical protein
MSAPDPECVVCGRVALDLSGWDGGFPAYREFRALWDLPQVFQSMVHFSCLRDWEHRELLINELVDLATDAVLEFDVEFGGKRYPVKRNGLGYTVRRFEAGDLLVLQHQAAGRWLIIDRTSGWQFVERDSLLRLVRGEQVYTTGGRGRYGIPVVPRVPDNSVTTWMLGDLLRHLGISAQYGGLADSGANLLVESYNPSSGWMHYAVEYPLPIHPAALAYFRDEYERAGEAAFAPLGIPAGDA